MKNVAVLKGDGEFTHFFRPHPGGFHSSRVPTPPREFAIQGKKNVNARGERWAQLELIDAMIMCTQELKC